MQTKERKQIMDEFKIVTEKMKKIKNRILVMSGKGGVGKSTVAATIAAYASGKGYKTGLLDVDIHGPSVPDMFNAGGQKLTVRENTMIPYEINEKLSLMSIGFMVNREEPLVWRGPLKHNIIMSFLRDTDWDGIEFLVVDLPPGTGDESISTARLLGGGSSAVIVTTPQKMAILDVEKAMVFCRQSNINIIGLVENMSGFKCPKCGEISHIFDTGGGKELAERMGVKFLGEIPLSRELGELCDQGRMTESLKKGSPWDAAVEKVFE